MANYWNLLQQVPRDLGKYFVDELKSYDIDVELVPPDRPEIWSGLGLNIYWVWRDAHHDENGNYTPLKYDETSAGFGFGVIFLKGSGVNDGDVDVFNNLLKDVAFKFFTQVYTNKYPIKGKWVKTITDVYCQRVGEISTGDELWAFSVTVIESKK